MNVLLIKSILIKLREAKLFEFLTTSQSVGKATVEICQFLLKDIDSNPRGSWTSIPRVKQFINKDNSLITVSDIKIVINRLIRAKIITYKGKLLTFTDVLMNNDQWRNLNKEMKISTHEQPSTVHSSYAKKDSGVSAESASESSSVVNQHMFRLSKGSSPLNSYFSSVNDTLNQNYSDKRSQTISSQNFSSEVNPNSHSSLYNMDSGFSRFKTNDRRLESISSSSNTSSNSKSLASPDPLKVAKSLYSEISFMSLMGKPKRIKHLSKSLFKLVVAARSESLQQADKVFKFEFKENYRKFGKIGNQINNTLMRLIESPFSKRKF